MPISPSTPDTRAPSAPKRRRTPRFLAGFPSPVRGMWEAAGPLMLFAALAAVPVGLLVASNGFDGVSQGGTIALGALTFLINQGVPVHYTLPASQGLPAVDGLLTLMPLTGVLLLVWTALQAGRRIFDRSSTLTSFALGSAGFVGLVAVVDAVVALAAVPEFAFAHPAAAALIPAAWSALGLLLGGLIQAGGPLAFLGRTEWLQSKGQWWRWGLDYVRAIARAAGIAILALVGVSALAFGAAIFWHWAGVITEYERVSSSLTGSTAVTAINLGYLPNFIAYTLAWLSGAGFSLGAGTLISPWGTTASALPPLPLVAAVPQSLPEWAPAVLALPVLCGAVASWWFLREGEDHLGEWLQLRFGRGLLASALGVLANSLIIGLAAGLFGALLTWAASGSLGIGRFTQMGADPLQVLWMLGLECFLGALLGFLAVPWLESD